MRKMIEWGQKSKPKKIRGPKINPKKDFMLRQFVHFVDYCITGFMKQMQCNALNINHPENKFGCTLFTELRGRDARALSQIFRFSLNMPEKIPT